MLHFILDTNIIIRYPAILAKGSEQIRFVITEAVILELMSFRQSNERDDRFHCVFGIRKRG